MSILIYSPSPCRRLTYISGFLFESILGIKCTHCHQKEAFIRADCPKVNYSSESFDLPCLSVPVHPFLSSREIKNWEIRPVIRRQLPAFFRVPEVDQTLDIDIFSMAFFLLSRYEEYLPFSSDQHGRFPAAESLAYRHQFLRLPLIDLWALEVRDLLITLFPAIHFSPPSYRFRPTVDIDMAWSFRNKGWGRSLGAYLKDSLKGNFSTITHRLKVQSGLQQDPFDTFDYLENLHNSFQLKTLYFWLVGDYGIYDKNSPASNKQFRQLIREISQEAAIGLHPSYGSNTDVWKIKEEKKTLEEISGQKIIRSRQHFLKLHLPATYRRLIDLGITEDFTMGYAANPGFRAGTSHPFHWYDLQKDEATPLQVHPFQVMDVSMKGYLGLSPEEALETIVPLISTVRKVKGQFISIWHNSSLSDDTEWKGWKKMYEGLLASATT